MVQRTTRITVETDTVLVVRRATAARAWCPKCAAEVDAITLTPESLSEAATANQLAVWLDTGRLHVWHKAEGAVQICVPSLLQCTA